MSDLPPALQVLLDKSDITELLTRYMRAIDRGDIAALRACYAPNATEEHGGLYAPVLEEPRALGEASKRLARLAA